jgi:hypothetical protein
LKAKTSYRRRRIELIVKRLEVRLEVGLRVRFEAKLEAESSIEVVGALDKFEGRMEYNNDVDRSTSYMEEPLNSL